MSIPKQIYQSFVAVMGWPLSFISFVLPLITALYVPDESIKWKYALIGLLPLGLALATMSHLAIKLCTEVRRPLPEVIQAMKLQKIYGTGVALLVLKPSEIFGQDSIVSVYQKKDSVEVLVGWGSVLTVQEDRMIQIAVRELPDAHEPEFWSKVINNEKNTLAELIVKPTLPKFLHTIIQ